MSSIVGHYQPADGAGGVQIPAIQAASNVSGPVCITVVRVGHGAITGG